jgi:hypothetical protein
VSATFFGCGTAERACYFVGCGTAERACYFVGCGTAERACYFVGCGTAERGCYFVGDVNAANRRAPNAGKHRFRLDVTAPELLEGLWQFISIPGPITSVFV